MWEATIAALLDGAYSICSQGPDFFPYGGQRPPWSPAAELVEAFIFLVAGLLSWGLGAGRLGHSCQVTGFIPILSFHGLLSYEGG